MATNYRIFINDGLGGPIDYGTVHATTAALTWPSAPLTAGTWRFGVRAFDTVSGMEEANVDAVVEIVIDASLEDHSAVPRPPIALSAVATANGGCHLVWAYPRGSDTLPAGFHVYLGSPTPDYLTPVETVTATGATQYAVDLTGLTDGITYQIGVRAFSAAALEEQNTTTTTITADATAPANVQNLAVS